MFKVWPELQSCWSQIFTREWIMWFPFALTDCRFRIIPTEFPALLRLLTHHLPLSTFCACLMISIRSFSNTQLGTISNCLPAISSLSLSSDKFNQRGWYIFDFWNTIKKTFLDIFFLGFSSDFAFYAHCLLSFFEQQLLDDPVSALAPITLQVSEHSSTVLADVRCLLAFCLSSGASLLCVSFWFLFPTAVCSAS